MPEVAVIVPTFNEHDNIMLIRAALDAALCHESYEIVFVDDDSSDGTPELIRALAAQDCKVRLVHRIGRSGLSSAVIEGMLATTAPYLAVIDADLQHDETVLPKMISKLRDEKLDLVVGSRNVSGGSMGDFSPFRVKLSDAGKRLSRLVYKAELSDPMSGFFVISRSFLDEVVRSLSARGFKILVDIVASSTRPIRYAEVGYTFRNRTHGESKLDILVSLEHIELLADKLVGNWVPVSYVLFAAVGTLGLIVNLVTVYVLLRHTTMSFSSAQLLTGFTVILMNFVLNNEFTFRRRRLRGRRFVLGMLVFLLACGIGLFCNWRIAEALRSHQLSWYAASVGGTLVGSVWNYWMSSLFIWQVHRKISRRASV